MNRAKLAAAVGFLGAFAVACGPGVETTSGKAVVAVAAATSLPTPAPDPGSGQRLRADLPVSFVSGNIPLAVNPPLNTSPENARPWFDLFSWQSFIALNWPADPSQRGVPLKPDDPSVFITAKPGYGTVWGAYKEAYELFGQGNKTPTPWASYDIPVPVCGNTPAGTKLLLMANKGGTVLDGANEAFSFPLIDQNKNYAWTEVRFDKAQYEFIRNNGFYLAKNLAAKQPINMPASSPPSTLGSIMLKATWREMTAADDQTRYYIVDALIYDPSLKNCVPKKMGLVGFHIAHKLAQFPEWIWSSFEQVDNIERGPGSSPRTPISFNNGTNNPKTVGGWANRPSAKVPPLVPPSQRTPTQVTRFNPIPTTPTGASTVDVNKFYQTLLAKTVWKNYQLVITQWPSDPGSFKTPDAGGIYPKDCGAAFPATGCVNTTMETYFQSPGDAAGAGGNSCMSCHYGAAKSDFSWVLQRRAH